MIEVKAARSNTDSIDSSQLFSDKGKYTFEICSRRKSSNQIPKGKRRKVC